MSGFICVFKELIFRLKLYLFGIRFYSRGTIVDAPLIYEANYRLDDEHYVQFKFYRIECTDIVMKRNRMYKDHYASFIVQAFLNNHFPEEVMEFNEKAFFFNGKTNSFDCSEQQTVELILDVYLDFLKMSYKIKKHGI